MTDRSKNAPKTAAELMAKLQRDPKFVAREQARKQEQDSNIRSYQEAARGVLQDLRTAGFQVGTVGELRTGKRYKKAVPVLVRWLGQVGDRQVKEDIVRTLSVPWATEAAPALIAEYRRADDPSGTGIRWAIANALEVVASEEVFADLVDLVRQRSGGKARQMLVLAVAKTGAKEAPTVLQELLSDEEVAGHAISGLAELRAEVPRAVVQPFLEHPAEWVRQDAQKLLS